MGFISLIVGVNSVPSLPGNFSATNMRVISMASYNNNNNNHRRHHHNHRNRTKRRLTKNLLTPRQTKLPPDFGVNLFLKNPKTRKKQEEEEDDDDDVSERNDEDECDEIVWESLEIEAITSLFRGRIPQKPGNLNRERPLPLPLPYKLRPLCLPTPKKRVRAAASPVGREALSKQVHKTPGVLIGLAREIKSLPADKDASSVLDKWGRFLRKGSLSMTIRELGHLGLPERALQVFCWAQKQAHLSPDDRVLASAVEVLARSRALRPPLGLERFVGLGSRGVVEAMVRGLAKGGSLSLAMKLLSMARGAGRTLDPGVYAKLVHELAKSPDRHGLAMALMDELGEREDLNLSQQDCTAVMKVCARVGRFETVESLYDWFRRCGNEPSVVMYTTMIHSRCLEGKYREAMGVVWEMEGSDCLLDLPAYRVVIRLFVALGDVSRASRYFSKLKESGFSATYDIYRDLIKLYMASERLAKCGDVCREAEMAGFKVDKDVLSRLR